MIYGHGGNIFALARELGCRPEELSDMSSNINPLGSVPGLLVYLQAQVPRIQSLPEVDAAQVCADLADLLGLDPDYILAGAGTTQFIYQACRALKSKRVLIVAPTYSDYTDACHQQGLEPDYFCTRAETAFRLDLSELEPLLPNYDTLFLCTPNNPSGYVTPLTALAALAQRHPHLRCIIDASYLPFAEPILKGSLSSLQTENLLILWSGSKIFAIPGLRTGFLIAHPDILAQFQHLAQPWSLSTLAQEAMHFLGANREAVQQFVQATYQFVQAEKALLHERLGHSQLRLFPSATSFILIQLPPHVQAEQARKDMQQQRLLIRNCDNFHTLDSSYIRVALKDSASNARFADAILALCASGKPA